MSAALLLTLVLSGDHGCRTSYYGQPIYTYQASPAHRGSAYGAAPGRTAARPVVQMTNRARFEPAHVTANVGETVEWQNASSEVHTVTADPQLAGNPAHVVLPEGARPFHSGDLPPGGRYSQTFTVPGIYYYVCLPHERMGMVGIIVVNSRERDQQPARGAAPPQGRRAGGY